MNCKNCGYPITNNDQFCKNCGTAVNSQTNFNGNVNGLNNSQPVNTQPNYNIPNSQENTQPNFNNLNQPTNIQPNINDLNRPTNTQPVFNDLNQPTNTQPNINLNQPNQSDFSNSNQFINPNSNLNTPRQPIMNSYNTQSNNNIKFIIIGIVVIVVIALIIFFVSKNDNSSNTNSNNNPTTTTPTQTETSVSYNGYTFQLPSNLIYSQDDGDLVIQDSNNSWLAQIRISSGNFDTYKKNITLIKNIMIKSGMNDCTDAVLKTVDGVELITFEATIGAEKALCVFSRLDADNVLNTIIMNRDYSIDYSLLENIVPIVKSGKKNSVSNNLNSNFSIDTSKITEGFDEK